MNKNAQKWVEALESGDYLQTDGQLKGRAKADQITSEDEGDIATGYCCLGVACDLYNKEGNGEWVTDEDGDEFFIDSFGNRNQNYLPAAVMNWLGLSSPLGYYDAFNLTTASGHHSKGQLAQDNDVGASFKDIAEIIKSEPHDLFGKAEV